MLYGQTCQKINCLSLSLSLLYSQPYCFVMDEICLNLVHNISVTSPQPNSVAVNKLVSRICDTIQIYSREYVFVVMSILHWYVLFYKYTTFFCHFSHGVYQETDQSTCSSLSLFIPLRKCIGLLVLKCISMLEDCVSVTSTFTFPDDFCPSSTSIHFSWPFSAFYQETKVIHNTTVNYPSVPFSVHCLTI